MPCQILLNCSNPPLPLSTRASPEISYTDPPLSIQLHRFESLRQESMNPIISTCLSPSSVCRFDMVSVCGQPQDEFSFEIEIHYLATTCQVFPQACDLKVMLRFSFQIIEYNMERVWNERAGGEEQKRRQNRMGKHRMPW